MRNSFPGHSCHLPRELCRRLNVSGDQLLMLYLTSKLDFAFLGKVPGEPMFKIFGS